MKTIPSYDHYYAVLSNKFMRINENFAFYNSENASSFVLPNNKYKILKGRDGETVTVTIITVSGDTSAQICVVPHDMPARKMWALAKQINKIGAIWSSMSLKYYRSMQQRNNDKA